MTDLHVKLEDVAPEAILHSTEASETLDGIETLSEDAQLGFDILSQNKWATFDGLPRDMLINFEGLEPMTLAHAMLHEPAFSPYCVRLPERLGTNACLDAAAICLFTAVGTAKKFGRALVPAKCMSQYAKAVQQLRGSVEGGKVETGEGIGNLAAAVFLMAVYEAAIHVDSWRMHMSGLAALYKMAGPTAFNSPFDRSIILATIGGFIEVAVANGQHCFLAEPAWLSLMQEHLPISIGRPGLFTHTRTFNTCWNAIPGLLADCRAIVDNPATSTNTEIRELLRRAWKIRYDLHEDAGEHIPTLRHHAGHAAYATFLANQNLQNTGNYAIFLTVHALTARVILTLETPAEANEDLFDLESECTKIAQEIQDLHHRLAPEATMQDLETEFNEVGLSDESRDLKPRFLMVFPGTSFKSLNLGYAAAILNTHERYLQHIRRVASPKPSNSPQRRFIDSRLFSEFHDALKDSVS